MAGFAFKGLRDGLHGRRKIGRHRHKHLRRLHACTQATQAQDKAQKKGSTKEPRSDKNKSAEGDQASMSDQMFCAQESA